MKILSAEQIHKADAATLERQGIASVALMDRAAEAFTARFLELYPHSISATVCLLCGPGNNGGDGLAVARLLFEAGYHPHVFVVADKEKRSVDFLKQYERLQSIEGIKVHTLKKVAELKTWVNERLSEQLVFIDAVFGIGLNQVPAGIFADVIEYVNTLQKHVVAIDIPSGMFADKTSVMHQKQVMRASFTLSFECPKMAFLFPENAAFLGSWELLSLNLDAGFLETVEVSNHFILRSEARLLVKPRSAFSHKGTFGHALIAAGSEGKMGAAVLAASACMRSGVGKLTVHMPSRYLSVMHTALPEAMVEADASDTSLTSISLKQNYQAVGLGPGIGTSDETVSAFKLFIQNYQGPLVLDADALNMLAANKTWLAFLAPGTVLTPHPKEFERLVGKWTDDFEKHQLLVNFAVKFRVCVVLKGAFTCIAFPDGSTSFNSTGNAGMATAGTGDALCGIITGLLAQGYAAASACMLGVYLHGLSGDLAAAEYSQEAMLASNLIDYLGQAYLELKKDTTSAFVN